jgi:hypothetical protein
MDGQDQERQDVEWIMRRAAELGHDPARVARALDHRPLPPTARQAVMTVERRAWFGARAARRSARRSTRGS